MLWLCSSLSCCPKGFFLSPAPGTAGLTASQQRVLAWGLLETQLAPSMHRAREHFGAQREQEIQKGTETPSLIPFCLFWQLPSPAQALH